MDTVTVQSVTDDARPQVLLVGRSESVESTADGLRDAQPAFAVTTATSGERAQSIVADRDVDCVVCAEALPDTDGVTVLYAIRETYPSMPVFLYAGGGTEELASEAISAGVTDYVPTTLAEEQPAVLANRILNAVEKHRAETALEDRERRLARLIDNLPGFVYRSEDVPPRTMALVQGECEQLTGYDAAAIEDGVDWLDDVVHPDDREDVRETISERLRDGDHYELTYRIRTDAGTIKWVWDKGCGVSEDDEVVALEGFITEITDRVERRQELREYETLLETIPDGAYVLDESFCFRTINGALGELTGYERDELLGAHISTLTDADAMTDSERLRSELLSGTRDVATMEADVETADGDRFPAELRFSTLSDDAGEEFAGTAGVLRDTTERKERKRQLERQRERLAAINQLHRVLEDITVSVIETPTREEMERRVCERLVESDSYALAWIGDVDRGTRTISPSTFAGDGDGYLDEVTITADETETGTGPAGTAVRTSEPQIVGDIATEASVEPWREAALDRGFRSLASIPITHRGSVYGVLTVYSERTDAFEDRESEILDTLGDVLGHAFNAFQRKKTLMGDVLTELEFRIPELESPLAAATEERDCSIAVDRTLPAGEDEFLQYLTIEGIDADAVQELADRVDSIDRVSLLGPEESGSDHQVEVSQTAPPLTSTVAAFGGRVRSGTVRDGEFHATVELPPDADVRSILEAVREQYADAELVAQRTTEQDAVTTGEFRSSVFEELTEKQRTALEAAYFSGFFEWPRENSGEEIADTLGVAPATFSQHIRTAERKIGDVLLEGDRDDESDEE
ncbi:MAG TPA: bacterio-opsin activator domain-containing protein [Natronoarchaeum rubrum]|nr:bacterio-opsin activator domain-containing protein [Natronoarchaeum rubrum]